MNRLRYFAVSFVQHVRHTVRLGALVVLAAGCADDTAAWCFGEPGSARACWTERSACDAGRAELNAHAQCTAHDGPVWCAGPGTRADTCTTTELGCVQTSLGGPCEQRERPSR